MKLIVKYGNRKLYDTEESKYVSIKELVEKFDLGSFKVVKYGETNSDITTEILLSSLGSEAIQNQTKVKVMQHCIEELNTPQVNF